jgi:hypothetical protein
MNLAIYTDIITYIEDFKPNVIYCGIGSSMKEHNEINEINNQQNPIFLNKYYKKVIILIDPLLENPLRLETQLELEIIRNDEYLRILKNENTLIFAINHKFYYSILDYDTDSNIYFPIQKTFLFSLALYTINTKIFMFIQDYTGNNIELSYIELFEIFLPTKVLQHIFFDITENNSGCYVDFIEHQVKYTNDDFFDQIKFLTLVKQKGISKYIIANLIKRINYVMYDLCRILKVITEGIDISENEYNNYKLIFLLLSVIYNDKILFDMTRENIIHIIELVLIDILTFVNKPLTIIDDIKIINFEQNKLINILAPLKLLV